MGETLAKAAPIAAPHYYHAADRFGPEIFLWLPVAGGLTAIAFGLIYAFIAYFCHVIDESGWLMMVTPFFAAALAYPGRWACQLGRVRERRLRLPIMLAVGAIGLYAAWHFYLNFARSEEAFDPIPTWHMSPRGVWSGMRDLASDRGFSSWFAWFIEAATVFGFIIYMKGEADPEVPFCEKCQKWASCILQFDLSDSATGNPFDDFKKGHVESLQRFGRRKSGKLTYLQVRVMRCPCRASLHASIDAVTIIPGKKGNLSTSPIVAGGRRELHYNMGSATTEETKPVIANMEIDDEMLLNLERMQTELEKGK